MSWSFSPPMQRLSMVEPGKPLQKPGDKKPSESVSDPISSLDALPAGVKAMRQKILEACAKGDIEALRIPIDWNEVRPLFERAGGTGPRAPGSDPIETLKRLSYDGKGREILLLLRAILKQSCVAVTQGASHSYVWPAFALKPPSTPTPEERQIMLSCVRFADLGKSGVNGLPPVLRVGIGADGTWHYFW